MRAAVYSLRRRLLGWLLISTAVIGVAALTDTYREAVTTANVVSDRVLAGSALAIAERVVVAEDGSLEVDIPYVALEMLTSAAQDRVFYRVDGPPGQFITGYQTLPSLDEVPGSSTTFADSSFRGEPIRIAALRRSASTGINSVPFVVTVAETTIARRQLAQTILVRSALRLGLMIAGAAVIVWIAVTFSLQAALSLRRCDRRAQSRRSASDRRARTQRSPGACRHGQFVHGTSSVGARRAAQFYRQRQPSAAHAARNHPNATGLGTARRLDRGHQEGGEKGRRGRCERRAHSGAACC